MWCFVDGGGLAEEVPRRLITAGAVFWVDVPPDVPVEEIHLTDEPADVVDPVEAELAEEVEAILSDVDPEPVPVVVTTPKRRPPRRKK